jgi:hypothetical protein
LVMQPKTKLADLPSSHDIRVYLKNSFVLHIKQLHHDIMVSTTGLSSPLT